MPINPVRKRSKRRFPAFTMMELLMVLTIIGILMAIGMVVYTRVQQTAMKKAAEIEMKQFPIAVLNYKLDKNEYPKSSQDLLQNGYITKELSLDPWDQEYRLEYDEENGILKIISSGPDKKSGTKDDITDEEKI